MGTGPTSLIPQKWSHPYATGRRSPRAVSVTGERGTTSKSGAGMDHYNVEMSKLLSSQEKSFN